MINLDSDKRWTEDRIETFMQLVEKGYLTAEGKLTDKGRDQLNSTRSFPIIRHKYAPCSTS